MSCYEWENGTITIPAKEMPALQKTLRDWQNAFHEDVRAKAVELHKTINTRSAAKYSQGIMAIESKRYGRGPGSAAYGFNFRAPSAAQVRADAVEDAALEVLKSIQYQARSGKKSIHQPTVKDVSVFAPSATNRTKTFNLDEASITFEKNQVTWDVPENNHAREHAAAHPLHDVFFNALGKVQWTRGSGGTICGNDEYNQENRGEGGGGNYVTRSFGPGVTSARGF